MLPGRFPTTLLLATALLSCIACTPPKTTITPLIKRSFPPKPKDFDIQVLTQPPADRKFEEIAILNTIAYGQLRPPFASLYMNTNDKDLNAMLSSIKEAARQLGADAVLLKNVEPGLPTDHESYGKAFAVAIKFVN